MADGTPNLNLLPLDEPPPPPKEDDSELLKQMLGQASGLDGNDLSDGSLAQAVAVAKQASGTPLSEDVNLSPEQLKNKYKGAKAEPVNVTDNVRIAYGYFRTQGYTGQDGQFHNWSDGQAKAIVANFYQESSLNPKGPPGDVSTGSLAYGIGQWRADRLAEMLKFVGAKSVGDLQGIPEQELVLKECAFAQHELTDGKDAGARRAGKLLAQTDDAGEGAAIFSTHFERPQRTGWEEEHRAGLAYGLDKYLGGAVASVLSHGPQTENHEGFHGLMDRFHSLISEATNGPRTDIASAPSVVGGRGGLKVEMAVAQPKVVDTPAAQPQGSPSVQVAIAETRTRTNSPAAAAIG